MINLNALSPGRHDLEGTPTLPRLRDQVSIAAGLDGTLDGSALWVLLAIYRAFAIVDRDQAKEVASFELTPLQFNILMVLQRVDRPTPMGALAEMLVVRPTNLSGNINTLVGRGLVRRELSKSDRRSLLPALTRRGHSFLNEHLPAHWRRLERLMGGLSREQRLQLVALLKALVLSMEDEQQRECAASDGEKKSPAA